MEYSLRARDCSDGIYLTKLGKSLTANRLVRLVEESFKLGNIREREMIAQASGEVMEWAGKRRAQADEDKKSLGKNVTEPKAEVDSVNYQANTQFCLVSQLSC